ncbi:MAG: O-antigen ligase family protein [Oscillospiraceae bacterium]|nr:O-antigen ligase family protein [Oscillospiraceae bacterium]
MQTNSVFADKCVAMAVIGSLFLPSTVSSIAIVLSAFYVMADYQRRERVFAAPFMKLLFGGFVVSFFIAASYRNYNGMAMTLMLLALLVFGMYLRGIMEHRLFHQLLDLACVMSIPAVVVAIFQKALTFASDPSYRPVSFFINANYFGMMIEFTVLIALYRAYTNRKFMPLYATVVGVNLIGIYLCSSMSALAAMSCGVIVFLVYKRRYKLSALYVSAVAAFFCANHFLPSLFPRVDAISATTSQRLSIWHGAVIGIAQTPLFGRGLRAYSIVHDSVGSYATYHCHNLYLDCLLNFGIIGCAVLLAFGSWYLHDVLRQIRTHRAGNAVLLFITALIVTLVHGCTDVTVCWTQTGMLFMLFFSATGICEGEARKAAACAAASRKYLYRHSRQLQAGYLMKNEL